VRRFLESDGAGPKIATMAASILVKGFRIPVSDRYSIDVSVDVHVRRVARRLGLVGPDCSDDEIIYRAREMNPKLPGVVDLGLWELGRTCCRSGSPRCGECRLGSLARGESRPPDSWSVRQHDMDRRRPAQSVDAVDHVVFVIGKNELPKGVRRARPSAACWRFSCHVPSMAAHGRNGSKRQAASVAITVSRGCAWPASASGGYVKRLRDRRFPLVRLHPLTGERRRVSFPCRTSMNRARGCFGCDRSTLVLGRLEAPSTVLRLAMSGRIA